MTTLLFYVFILRASCEEADRNCFKNQQKSCLMCFDSESNFEECGNSEGALSESECLKQCCGRSDVTTFTTDIIQECKATRSTNAKEEKEQSSYKNPAYVSFGMVLLIVVVIICLIRCCSQTCRHFCWKRGQFSSEEGASQRQEHKEGILNLPTPSDE